MLRKVWNNKPKNILIFKMKENNIQENQIKNIFCKES